MCFFNFKHGLISLFLIALISCNSASNSKSLKQLVSDLGYSIEKVSDCYVVQLKEVYPNSNTNESYCLCPKGKSISGDFTQQIEIPVKSVGISSTTHLGFLKVINQVSSIKAATNLNLYFDEEFNSNIEKGLVKSLGFGQVEEELLIDQELDVLFSYAIDAASYEKAKRLRGLGQKVILVSEFMEQDPLNKAKWLEFFSALYGKKQQDISKNYLDTIELEYNRIKEKTERSTAKPKVMLGMPWKGNWYVSGANTYQAKFIRDAGAEYQWKDFQIESSTPIAFEKVLLNSVDAEFWLNPGNYKSKNEIMEVDQRFGNIAAFKNGSIYSHYKRSNLEGANDYWESGVVEPHLILADLVHIFQPNIMANHQLKYYYRIDG